MQEAKGFLKAYRRMAPFASADETRRTLQCVYVDVSGTREHNATLVATDSHRLCCCNSLSLPVDDEHGDMVPVTKLLLWNRLAEDVQMGVSKTKSGGRVCVKSGPWTYRVKAVDGQYPNWRQAVPVKDGMAHTLTFAAGCNTATPASKSASSKACDNVTTVNNYIGLLSYPATNGAAYASGALALGPGGLTISVSDLNGTIAQSADTEGGDRTDLTANPSLAAGVTGDAPIKAIAEAVAAFASPAGRHERHAFRDGEEIRLGLRDQHARFRSRKLLGRLLQREIIVYHGTKLYRGRWPR